MLHPNSTIVMLAINRFKKLDDVDSVLDSMETIAINCSDLLRSLQRPLSPAHQGTKLEPSLYLFWI